jgi:aquaporin Z
MKRYVMESIGTFFLTIAISLTGNPIAIGLMLIIMVYIGSHVSGGHYNPAVSFTFFLEKRLSRHDLMMYWLAQSFGAIGAVSLFMILTNNMFIPEVIPGASVLVSALLEGLLTIILCWACLTMIINHRYSSTSLQGIIIGLTLMTIAFIGGLFNPAVAIGSIVCNLMTTGIIPDMATLFIYIAGPLMGSLGASFLFNYFRSYDR